MKIDNEVLQRFERLSELEISIMEAAKEHFQKFGFANTNVENIALELGIGKGTIYRHFGNKHQLLLSVLFYLYSKYISIEDVFEGLSMFEEKLDKLIDALIHFGMKWGRFFSVFQHVEQQKSKEKILNNLEIKKMFEASVYIRENSIRQMSELLDEGVREGKIHSDIDTYITAELITITVNQFIFLLNSRHAEVKKKYNLGKDIEVETGCIELRKYIYRALGLNSLIDELCNQNRGKI